MATYAIGDVQGCFAALEALLARLPLGPADRLWLAGDLVNRGPDSLAVLRWARAQGERLTCVLGNHDLHLLGCAAGVRAPGRGDTFQDVLAAPEREELLEWLASRPLLVREGERLLVHAGLLPRWSAGEAEALAREAEAELRGPGRTAFLAHLAARDRPRARDPGLTGPDRLAAAVDAFTRLRTCSADGAPCEGFSGPPEEAPPGCLPWFRVPGRRTADVTVVCGHWAALGLHVGDGVVALDSGCVWGQALTAVRLEDGEVFQVRCRAEEGEPERPQR